jgi:hypothetical protein
MMKSINTGGIRDRLRNNDRKGFIPFPPSSDRGKINQLLLMHIGSAATTAKTLLFAEELALANRQHCKRLPTIINEQPM